MDSDTTVVYCNHKDCQHLKLFEEGPKHLPKTNPVDWDPGYAGICQKKTIGVKVREVRMKSEQGANMSLKIPECQLYSCRKNWRIRLPYPDEIQKRGGRSLGSQEHDSSR